MAMDGYRGFLGLLVSALLVGFLSVLFTLIWVLHYREGLGWDGNQLEFNWHPALAVTGFVFIQGIAIIVYRLPWTWKCSKLLMKSIHAGLNTIAAILAIISLVAVFDFHNAKAIPNMYSLHSWVGLTAVILYILQAWGWRHGNGKEPEEKPGSNMIFWIKRKNGKYFQVDG